MMENESLPKQAERHCITRSLAFPCVRAERQILRCGGVGLFKLSQQAVVGEVEGA